MIQVNLIPIVRAFPPKTTKNSAVFQKVGFIIITRRENEHQGEPSGVSVRGAGINPYSIWVWLDDLDNGLKK